MQILNPSYARNLSHYEKTVINLSHLTKDVYWTHIKDFTLAKCFYSDPINDYFWTLVEQIEAKDEAAIRELDKEVVAFFKPLKKQFSYYLSEYDRSRSVHIWLKNMGYQRVMDDTFMSVEGINEKTFDSPSSNKIVVKEVTTDKDNETYIEVYSKAYNSNPDDVYYSFGDENTYENIYRKTWKNPNVRQKVKKFVGYIDSIPASCGAIYYNHDIAYLCEVGTDNAFRNRGLARQVSVSCIISAKKLGAKTIMLSTEANSPAEKLYSSIGFKPKVSFWGMSKEI